MVAIPDVAGLRITQPDQVREAAFKLRAMVETLWPLRIAACHNVALNAPMVDADGAILATSVFGWTDAEEDRWWKMPNLALESPLTAACRFESEPFWCNADGFRSHHRSPFLNAIDVSNFEQRALAVCAIVVPIHLPFGQVGAVSFTPVDPSHRQMDEAYAQFGDLLAIYARIFVASYAQTMSPIRRLPPATRLTKREVECLRWAAIGKTDDEIGMIMSRSRGTIRFHLQNASTKLDSVNRSQTLFKAAQLGYIGLAS